jgi:hypothetical protein
LLWGTRGSFTGRPRIKFTLYAIVSREVWVNGKDFIHWPVAGF